MEIISRPCSVQNASSSGRLAISCLPSLTISHSTPTGAQPAIRARSIAASV